MKKIITIIILIILSFYTIACNNTLNTPSDEAMKLLNRYQNLDNIILLALDKSINNNSEMNKIQKQEYKDILIRQYQNLSYKIKNEIINNENATVDVELEVLNYHSSLLSSREYYINHNDEFNEENTYIDYKLNQLKKVNDKIKYNLTLNLTRDNNVWKLRKISRDDLKKIHGLY